MAVAALAKHCGLDFDPAPLRGNYSPQATAPRELPTDGQIVAARDGLDNPAWRWVFGVMACYRLRNHEVFHLDLSEFPRVRVLESTKTGAREVWPCFPEWAEGWELDRRVLPPVDVSRPNQKIGHSVTKYLSPLLPFQPYDLRHAWAVRTLLFGWPIELSARQMGHSVEVHSRTYQRWISSQQIESVYQLLVARADRPRPPEDSKK
jgi:integrase